MPPKTNPNYVYVEHEDGFYKRDDSQQRGSADYFSRPAPPVRDAATGHPIGSDGQIDWKRVCDEANKRQN